MLLATIPAPLSLRKVSVLLGAACLFAAGACPGHAEARSVYVDRLQYRLGPGWFDVPAGPIYVLKGTRVTFRALPAGGKWGHCKLHWTSAIPMAGRGSVRSLVFSHVARHRGDFQILSARAGTLLSARVLVYDLEPTMTPVEMFPGRSMNDFGLGEDVRLGIKVTPFLPVQKIGRLGWATTGFPGTAAIQDAGRPDGKAILSLGFDDVGYTIRLSVMSGPSRGQYHDMTMTSSPVPASSIDPAARELYSDMGTVDQAARKRNFTGVRKLSTGLKREWRRRDSQSYLTLMRHVCELLETQDFDDAGRFALAQHLARLALPITKKSGPGEETLLLVYLLRDLDYENGRLRGSAWKSVRRQKTLLWLRAIHDVTAAIAWSFDVTDTRNFAYSNILMSVPLGSKFLEMLPSWLTAPRRRALHAAAMARNRRKALRMNEQVQLHTRLTDLWSYGEDYIVRAYRKRPGDARELRDLLREYHVPPQRPASILRRVAAPA